MMQQTFAGWMVEQSKNEFDAVERQLREEADDSGVFDHEEEAYYLELLEREQEDVRELW